MITYPLKFPRQKHRRPVAKKRPSGLVITSVKRSTAPTQVKIYFEANVAWNGSDVPAAFMCYTSDGFMDSCINVLGSGPDWIEVEFNGDVLIGAEWQVEGPMNGITPAVAWPQSGVVTA